MLRPALNDALKSALKSGDKPTLSTVRLILAALKDRDIEARAKGNAEGIADSGIVEMMQKMVKQREESIVLYKQGNRADLVRKEDEEIAVIRRFMPQQMSDADTEAAVKALLAEIGAAGVKDMGRAMAAIKERFGGQIDMGRASAIAKSALLA